MWAIMTFSAAETNLSKDLGSARARGAATDNGNSQLAISVVELHTHLEG